MSKKIMAALLAVLMVIPTLPSAGAEEPVEGYTGSISGEHYNAEASTADCTILSEEDSNAADLTSVRIQADAGEQMVFNDLDFDSAEVLMMEAAIDADSTSRNIALYIDTVEDANQIGTLQTRSISKVSDLDFNEQYAELTAEVSGVHDLILQFEDAVSLELDWLKLTSYTGSETEEERDERMEWWRDAKFGQFIHLGAYSYLGGWYEGQKGSFYSEWIMDSLKISKEDYAAAAADNFNPKDFDAAEIVSNAKAAGQKYLVITSRHHEGFSIFDTQIRNFRDYSLFSTGAYNGPDILEELSNECREQGIHFGVYITIMDWHDESQSGWNYNSIAEGHTKEEYKARLKGQIKELIEEYGVEVFFFDGEWVNWWTEEDGQEVYRYILSLNENCIVNNRVGKRGVNDGDYGTPEQEIPATGLDYDWESNVTMNDNWGYCIGDNNWKSSQWIVESVLDIASKGGNLLLNVGPDGNGVVEQEPIDRMTAAGTWFAQFGEAVYGTRASCFASGVPGNVRVTTKPDEGKLYLSLLRENPNNVGSISIPALDNEIIGVKELATGADVPYAVVNGKMQLTVSGTQQQQYATVYEITVDGVPTAAESAGDTRTNLALEKTVERSSAYDAAHEADWLVDGVTAYDAQTDNRWAPLDNNPTQWVSIDLGEERTIREVVAYEWWDQFFGHNYRCASYKLYTSKDNAEWTEVAAGTTIGERLSIILEEPTTARYVKLETTSGSSNGSVGLLEIQVYEELLPAPEISITNTNQLVETLPLHLEGTYVDGASVEVKVWSASFAAFTVPATVDVERGTWYVDINKDGIQPTEMTLTATLKTEDGQVVALDVWNVEYTGRENLAAGAETTESTAYVKPGTDHSAAALVNGTLSGESDRWAPADNDAAPWAVIDFGTVQSVDTIVLYEWWDSYFDLDYRCRSFQLSVSEDNETWTPVYTGTTIGQRLSIQLDTPVNARYVKIHEIVGSSSGNVSLHEIAVYGKEAKPYDRFDINQDGTVDLLDVLAAVRWYRAAEGDPVWNAAAGADVDGSGTVGVQDLIQIAQQFT